MPSDGVVITSTLASDFHWSISEIARSKVPSTSPLRMASRRVAVRDRLEDDALDHRLRAPIGLVGLEHDMVGRRELDQLVGPGAERQHVGRAEVLGMALELALLEDEPGHVAGG